MPSDSPDAPGRDRSPGGDEPPPATVRDVIARVHAREGPALVAPERATDYSAREFATGVRKAANLLSHYGVAADRPLAVAVGPKDPDSDAEPGRLGTAADPLLAALGGLTLGVPVDLAPTTDATLEAATLVAPAAWLDRFDDAPGTAVLAYGGPPEDPTVSHFERERWSENPTPPPEPLDPDQPALAGADARPTHADLLAAAEAVVERASLDGADRVEIACRVDSTPAFVAGVLAPLLAGTPIRPVPATQGDGGDRGLVAVRGSEQTTLPVDAVY